MKKRKSRFFERLKEDKGDDWLLYVSPEELNRNAISFFKDLAFGSVDKTVWGEAFSNRQFMDIMITRAKSEYLQSNILLKGLNSLAMTDPLQTNDPQFNYVYAHMMRRTSALYTIYNGLNSIYQSNNLGWLDWISNDAKQYRYDL